MADTMNQIDKIAAIIDSCTLFRLSAEAKAIGELLGELRRSSSSVSEGEMPELPIQYINMAQAGVGERAHGYVNGWNDCVDEHRRAATKAAAPADAHSRDCGNRGCTGCANPDDLARELLAPAEDAREEVPDAWLVGEELFRCRDAIPFRLLPPLGNPEPLYRRRASSTPAIPGTGRAAVLEEAAKVCDSMTKLSRENAERHKGPNGEDEDGYVDAYLNKAMASAQCAEGIRAIKVAAPSHPSEAKAGGEA